MTDDLELRLKAYMTDEISKTRDHPEHQLYYMRDNLNPMTQQISRDLHGFAWDTKGFFSSAWKLWTTSRKMSSIAAEYESIGAYKMAAPARDAARYLRRAIFNVNHIRQTAAELRELEKSYDLLLPRIPPLFDLFEPFTSREYFRELMEKPEPMPHSNEYVLIGFEQRCEVKRLAVINELQKVYVRGKKYLPDEKAPIERWATSVLESPLAATL